MASAAKQQADFRPGVFYDQHGRAWSGIVDKRSGFPRGVIQPKGWRAPWYPPSGPEVFKFHEDDPSRFRINYEWLLQERAKAAEEYDHERTKEAVARGWDATDPEKQKTLDLIVGPRENLQRPEIVKACMDGNPYALGLTKEPDPRVVPFLESKRDRVAQIKAQLPDFSVVPASPSLADDVERLMDIQEDVDRDATPKGTVPHRPKKQKAPKGVAA